MKLTLMAFCSVLLCLPGCADLHWERAFYDGARQGAVQCTQVARPTEPPCVSLPDYSRYEKERARTRNETAPDVRLPQEQP